MVDIARNITKVTAPISRRVRLLARRAVVKLVYDDKALQELQLGIFSGEVRDGVERFQEYGFTSRPFADAEAIVLALGGSSDHSVAIKVDDRRYRLKSIAQGEVAVFDDQGQAVHLKRNKQIHVYGCDRLTADVAVQTDVTCPLVNVTASTKVTLTTPEVEITGNIQIGGNLAAAGNGQFGGGLTMTGAAGSGDINTPGNIADGVRSMADDRTIYNGHTHPGDSGGTTGSPDQSM